jgi:putative membrane protein
VLGLIVRTGIALAANAVGLIVAALVLDGMEINAVSFVVAVIIFTVVFAVLQPFLAVQLRRLGTAAVGGVSLFATLASLIITDLVSDGFTIDGVGTWIAAAVIVWIGSLVAVFVLPYLGLKKYLEKRSAA